MKTSLIVVLMGLLLPANALAFGGIDDPGAASTSQPGASWSRVDLSWVSFSSYFDENGKKHSLNRAYSSGVGDAHGVGLDALVISFSGRFVVGPGCSAGLYVPLVRDSRSGRVPIAPGVEQSVYAEGSAIGDIHGDVTLEAPFPGTNAAFGASLAMQVPSGTWHRLDSTQLPTGNGALGAGGELFAVWREERWSVSAAAGLLVFLPRHEKPDDVDLGDPLWGRANGTLMVGESTTIGLELAGINRSADRVGRSPATTLTAGGTPGTLSPRSSLVTVGPFLEARVARSTYARIAISNPGTGWLFVPVQTGFAVRGRNVLAPEAQVSASVQARF